MRMGVVLSCSANVSNLNASPENVATTGNLTAYGRQLDHISHEIISHVCNIQN